MSKPLTMHEANEVVAWLTSNSWTLHFCRNFFAANPTNTVGVPSLLLFTPNCLEEKRMSIIANKRYRRLPNNVRVNIAQKWSADLTNLIRASSDDTMTRSVVVFLDGVSFWYRERFTTESQRDREFRIAWDGPDCFWDAVATRDRRVNLFCHGCRNLYAWV